MNVITRTLYVAFVALLSLAGLGGLLIFESAPALADVVLDEARFVHRMNADRAAAGVAPLVVAPRLIEIARAWSRLLSDRSTSLTECTLSHNQNLLELLRPASKVAENVGCGDGNADALHDAFMNSPHHRTNILDPAFDSVGVGVFMNGETMFVSVEFVRSVVVAPPVVVLAVPFPKLVPVPATAPSVKSSLGAPSEKSKIAKPAAKAPAQKVAPKKTAKLAKASSSLRALPLSWQLSSLKSSNTALAKQGTGFALRAKRNSRFFTAKKSNTVRSSFQGGS
jgi:Cysteine-rich secretory protein family